MAESLQWTWNPQQPVEDCMDCTESGGITTGEAQKLSTAYNKVFSTENFHSKCCRWYETVAPYKTWENFKIHFATAYRQHNQMHRELAAASWYANADLAQPEDEMSEAALGAFANLATATSVDRESVATLTDANFCLAKQLKESDQALKEIRALLKKECSDRAPRKTFESSLIINDGPMATRFPKATQIIVATFPRMVTSMMPPRTPMWEDPR
jgi:hypothetical protein